jgi:hypothetical protein
VSIGVRSCVRRCMGTDFSNAARENDGSRNDGGSCGSSLKVIYIGGGSRLGPGMGERKKFEGCRLPSRSCSRAFGILAEEHLVS